MHQFQIIIPVLDQILDFLSILYCYQSYSFPISLNLMFMQACPLNVVCVDNNSIWTIAFEDLFPPATSVYSMLPLAVCDTWPMHTANNSVYVHGVCT